MAQLPIFLVFMLIAPIKHAMTFNVDETELPEQLFLDLSIQGVLNSPAGMELFEPWATEYVDAIREGRFGDAIWARYHISGDVENGIVGDTNLTVLQSIEEDAEGYKANAPEQYTEALSFYANTSNLDEHVDVMEVIWRIGSTPDPSSGWYSTIRQTFLHFVCASCYCQRDSL